MNTIELASTQELIMELLTRGEMVLAMSTAVDGEPEIGCTGFTIADVQ